MSKNRSDHKQKQHAREVNGSSATSEQEGQDIIPRHMFEVLCGSGKGSEDYWRHRPEPRNQGGLIRQALATVALKVLDENPGPPPDCTKSVWYQGNVYLIACEVERSAALYKAAITKVCEVYPGARLTVCEAADILSCTESEGVAAV